MLCCTLCCSQQGGWHWLLSSRSGVTVADKCKCLVKVIARKSLRILCIKKTQIFLRKRKFSGCLCVTRDLAHKTHKSPPSWFYIINSSTKLRSLSLGSLPLCPGAGCAPLATVALPVASEHTQPPLWQLAFARDLDFQSKSCSFENLTFFVVPEQRQSL